MIVKVKDNAIININKKREFLIYLIEIKHNIKIHKMLSKYKQHGKTTVYIHSRNVAYYSFLFAKFLEKYLKYSINYETLIVGAMFHDFFLYDWHKDERQTKASWI